MGKIQPIKVDRPAGRRPRTKATDEVAALLNLGPKTAAWLADADIRTREEIARLGVIGVCRQLRAAGHPVSVLMAYALEGALTGCPWNQLPGETKQWLQAEFSKLKNESGRARPKRR